MKNEETKIYPIEKGIPIPSKGRSQFTDLLRSMEVGDSVLSDLNRQFISATCGYIKTRLGIAFTTRAEGESVRIWRIS